MITITYIIGNGFDVGLGLKTDYRNFIKWYLKQTPSESKAVARMRAKIDSDMETWSDAEMALAQLPFSDYGKDVRSVAMECLHDLSRHLAKYVSTKENLVVLPQNGQERRALRRNFAKSLFEVFRCDEDYFFPCGAESADENILINTISLNYSHVFDSLLPTEKIYYKEPDAKKAHKIRFSSVLHLHGEVGEGGNQPPLMGVSDEEHIFDKRLRRFAGEYGYLLKFKTDETLNYSKYADAYELLKSSDIVVLFGTSLGQSDSRLRDIIVEIALEKIRTGKFVRLYHSVYQKHYRGKPKAIEFESTAESVFSSYFNDYSEMPGQRDDLKSVVLATGAYCYEDPDGNKSYFDPLHLNWLKSKIVRRHKS